jgi:hypothetical protein
MKILIEVPEQSVYDYWALHDKRDNDSRLRPDITGSNLNYPQGITWYSAEIDDSDIEKLYVISTGDFKIISGGTWLVLQCALNYPRGIGEQHHLDRINRLLVKPGGFDPRIITVSNSADGPLTIIEGNHRAMIMQNRNILIGQYCFLGLHKDMRNYSHLRKAYAKYS